MTDQNPKFKKGDKVYIILTVSNPEADTMAGKRFVEVKDDFGDEYEFYEAQCNPVTKAMIKSINAEKRKEIQDKIKVLQKELDALE